jgi:uncharacterized membrane protein HdeD (DUF308 family)
MSGKTRWVSRDSLPSAPLKGVNIRTVNRRYEPAKKTLNKNPRRSCQTDRKEELVMATVAARVDQSNIWWVFLLQGIAALIFGGLLLTAPAATLLAMTVFLGLYLLFIGVLELVRVFVDRSQPWIWSLLIGILGIVAGIVVLNHPVLAAIALPTTVVVYLGVVSLVMGVAGIIGGFTGGGIGSFLLGAVSVLIGLLLLGAPMTTALAVPFVFGILLLIEGIALIVFAFRVKD